MNALKSRSTPAAVRYEVEWPASADCESMEFEYDHRQTLTKARALARQKAKSAPIGVAYITREIYTGNLNPWDDERGWEREADTREEISA